MARSRAKDRKLGEVQAASPIRRALAARVSTEDQAGRGTIRAQLDFMRQRTALDNKAREMQGQPPIVISGEYLDDGASGAIPLADRPDGGRLLEDSRAGLHDEVLWYRLDRMGRSLSVLMDAHDRLEASGVTVISATEPFDTSTPFGKAMFQFLGLMAELERATIADRMNNGRDTAVRRGKWTNGVIPFGFDVDADGCLVVSEREVLGTGMTEAEVAVQVFERMAYRRGETLFGLCAWLNALGVPTESRYPNGTVRRGNAEGWQPARVHAMIQRPIYSGQRTFNSRLGAITRDEVALVSPELQADAIARMADNARLPSHSERFFLLRGLVECGECGRAYVGVHSRGKPYYRCNRQISQAHADAERRCKAKVVAAEELEEIICDYVRAVERNPGSAIAEAREAVRDRSGRSVDHEVRRETLLRRIKELTTERERVMTLYRLGHIELAEAGRQLDALGVTLGVARSELEAIRAQQELTEATEAKVLAAAAALTKLTSGFDGMTDEERHEVIALLVPSIVVRTVELPERQGKVRKDYQVEAHPIVGSLEQLEAVVDSPVGS
jgi:site-specific DNA recombinase